MRFKLTEPQTDVSFGGELKYPAIHTNNTPAELMFYFVKGFSLGKLYETFFAREQGETSTEEESEEETRAEFSLAKLYARE